MANGGACLTMGCVILIVIAIISFIETWIVQEIMNNVVFPLIHSDVRLDFWQTFFILWLLQFLGSLIFKGRS
jgi:ABC-type multidrug transport system fused ATPase/permease subunit